MDSDTQRFIEVLGRADYTVDATEHRMGVSLIADARGGRIERHFLRNAVDEVVAAVIESGFPKDQILFDGLQDATQWWRKTPQKTTRSRLDLIFFHETLDTILDLPVVIDTVKLDKISVEIGSSFPVFETNTAAVEQRAYADAVAHARAIATSIADASGVSLGPLLIARQEGISRHGFDDAIMVGGFSEPAGGGAPPAELGAPTRKNTVELRVRFGLEVAH